MVLQEKNGHEEEVVVLVEWTDTAAGGSDTGLASSTLAAALLRASAERESFTTNISL